MTRSNILNITVAFPPSAYTISLTPTAASIQVGGSITFTVTALSTAIQPLSNTPITARLNGSPITSGKTDASGAWTFSLTFKSSGSFAVDVVAAAAKSNVSQVTVTAAAPAPVPPTAGPVTFFFADGTSATISPLSPAAAFALFQQGGCQSGFNPAFWALWAAGNYSGMPAIWNISPKNFGQVSGISLPTSWGPFTCLPQNYLNVGGLTY